MRFSNICDVRITEERQKLIAEVDKEWKQICKKDDTEDELYEDVNDCITKVITRLGRLITFRSEELLTTLYLYTICILVYKGVHRVFFRGGDNILH